MTKNTGDFDYMATCKAESEILVKLVEDGELTLEEVIEGGSTCIQKYESRGGIDTHSGASWYCTKRFAVVELGGDVQKIFQCFIAPLPRKWGE